MQEPVYRPDGHGVSDGEGATWNGVVGKIELSATSPVWIDDAQVFPDLAKKSAQVRVTIGNKTDKAGSGTRWNHLVHKPKDGAYLKGRTTGRIYQMKSGVARYVASWTQVGGWKPSTPVDQKAIDMAGTRTPVKWSHIAATAKL